MPAAISQYRSRVEQYKFNSLAKEITGVNSVNIEQVEIVSTES